MSLDTRTYAELLSQIKAKFGVSGLSESEEAMVLPLVNARSYEAYQGSQNWPRYLVSGQPRSVNARQVISRTQDGLQVSGAGTEGVNGLYEVIGTYNGSPAYSLAEYSPSYYLRSDAISFFVRPGGGRYLAPGSNIYAIRKNASGYWEFIDGDSFDDTEATVLYSNLNGEMPYDGIWGQVDGLIPAPLVFDLYDISEFLRIHQRPSFVNLSSAEFDFYVTQEGAHLMNTQPSGTKVAYVTYKKDFKEFTALSDDIPREWFYFIAGTVYSDLLRMQGRTEQAQLEQDLAQNYISNEMERVNNLNNSNLIRRFSTHLSRQKR